MPLAWWVGRRVRTGSFIQAAASGRVLAARAGGEKTCFSRRGQDDHRRSGRAGTQSGELGKMPNRFSGFSSPGPPVAELLLAVLSSRMPVFMEAGRPNATRSAINVPPPEHSDLEPKAHWDRRARGLGATLERPATSCGEENLLCMRGDPYATENILIHEFAHTIHQIGLAQVDATFQNRLEAAFTDAKQAGRWANTYAMQNPAEYWAEGVQSWLSCNRTNDREHGAVNSPASVRKHDPPLAALLAEVFGEEPRAYCRPADRPAAERQHLDGFDAESAPVFRWDALKVGGN